MINSINNLSFVEKNAIIIKHVFFIFLFFYFFYFCMYIVKWKYIYFNFLLSMQLTIKMIF